MKFSLSRLAQALVVSAALCSVAAAVAQDKPFHLAGDQEEAPFGYMNEKKEFVGIYADILKEAFKRMNVKYELKGYPWARAQNMVANLEADAMITVVTPERERITTASTEPLAEHQWVAFARKDNPKFQQIAAATKIDDLKGLKVLDYLGDGWGEKNLTGLDVDRSGNYSQVLFKLGGQRGDVFVQMKLPTQYELKILQQKDPGNDGLAKIVSADKVLDTKKFYLLVAKKSPYAAMLPQFDKTLKDMRADGTLQKINDQYIK